jgi:hypothetical protein
MYKCCPGSDTVEQRKVDLDWKSGSATASGTRGFLQHADTSPNVGAKVGGREEEEGMNEPRGPGGAFILVEGLGSTSPG